MSVLIDIVKIQEVQFQMNNFEIDKLNKKKLSFEFKFDFDFEKNADFFYLKCSTKYNYKLKEKDLDLLVFTINIGFHAEDLKKYFLDENKFEFPEEIMITFISTAISTTRGMLAYKLQGTYLSNFYLPLMDIKDLTNQILKYSDSNIN